MDLVGHFFVEAGEVYLLNVAHVQNIPEHIQVLK